MDGSRGDGFRDRPMWVAALAVVVLGQVGLTAIPFGGFGGIRDDRPVVSGRHPLHLYHGILGAESLRDGRSTACYDPAFQAGYPKTPVFDGGSRPAELVLAVVGTGHANTAYKGMLLAVSLFVPLAFALSGRGAGLSAAGSCLAAVGGIFLWWSPPVRSLFDAGDLDLLLAGLLGIVCVGAFARYHREAGPVSWMVLAAVAVGGWYAHPVVWIGLTPILFCYYLALAPRHGPAWHLGLAGVLIAGLAPNIWWLSDWGQFWWLREQQALADGLRPPGPSDVFGSPAEVAALLGETPTGWPLVLAGLVGCLVMTRYRRRTSAWLFAATIVFVTAVARLGQMWPPVQALGLERAAPFAAGLAIVPTAFLLSTMCRRSLPGRLVLLAVVLVPAGLASVGESPYRFPGLDLERLPVGLTDGQKLLVEALADHTTAAARILIEDSDPSRPGWNWTALLPRLTQRAFLGGLDGQACVDLTYCGLTNGQVNHRSLAVVSDDELGEICRTYNIGWVVCRPEAAVRWKAWPKVREIGRFDDGGEVVLLEIDRPRSYVLTGSATVTQADRRQIVLTDLVASPEGDLLLSFHHQPGMRVAPPTVVMDEGKDAYDPTKFIRLRIVSGRGVARVVIRWDP